MGLFIAKVWTAQAYSVPLAQGPEWGSRRRSSNFGRVVGHSERVALNGRERTGGLRQVISLAAENKPDVW